jgi:protein TonB
VRLGVPPSKVSDVLAIYPQAARSAGITGVIIVEVLIDRGGNVVRTKVLRPINPLLDDAAETAIRQWKYAPTVIRGEAVSVTTTVTVNFGVK